MRSENFDINPVFIEQQYGPEFEEPVQQSTAFDPSTVPDASAVVKGKIQIASQGDVDAGTDSTRAVTAATLKNSPWAKRKATATIGDGSTTTFDITHNFNTRDVGAEIYKNSGNFETITAGVEVRRYSVDIVRLVFTSAPTFNEYRVVVWN